LAADGGEDLRGQRTARMACRAGALLVRPGAVGPAGPVRPAGCGLRLRAEPGGWPRPLRGSQSRGTPARRGRGCCLWWVGLRVFGRLGWAVCLGCRRGIRGEGWLLAHHPRLRQVCGQAALPGVAFVPYAGAVPDGGRRGFEAAVAPSEPPSSSGLGHRPFKAAARVQIPLGALCWPGAASSAYGPVEQLGVLATLSRWRSRVQIPSGPLWPSGHGPRRGQVAQLV
jgi:hypothetical protein